MTELKRKINERLQKRQRLRRLIKVSSLIILIIIVAGLAEYTVISNVVQNSIMSSSGSFINADNSIYLYTDSSCNTSLGTISWGSVYLNQTVRRSLYILNKNSYPLQLHLTTANWKPNGTNIQSCFKFEWNLGNNTILQPNKGIDAELMLTLIGLYNGTNYSFGFGITIVGDQVV